MNKPILENLAATARCDADSIQDIYSSDADKTPDVLREENYTYTNSDNIPAERYTSRAFQDLEIKYIWQRTWQVAGREEELPNPGDFLIYDIADLSLIVVRQKDGSIAAHHNFCVHRGRKLKTTGGNASSFRCPFHAWEYHLDGSSKNVPCKWDFAHMSEADFALRSARVETWGGFIFINMSQDAPSLKDYMGEVWNHFDDYPLEKTYIHQHIRRPIACNWKVCLEAFCEGYHTIATHPQLLPYLADANSQYDNYTGQNFNRMLNAQGVHSPHLDEMTDQQVVDAMLGSLSTSSGEPPKVPEGMTARAFLAGAMKQAAQAYTGIDHSDRSAAEMLDVIQYTVFPNFFPWGGTWVNTIGYTFRPNGLDPDSCILDIYTLRRFDESKPRPASARVVEVTSDQKFSEVEGFEAMGKIFDQDLTNLELVQQGLKASRATKGAISLGNYQECRIRDLHETLDRFIAEGRAKELQASE